MFQYITELSDDAGPRRPGRSATRLIVWVVAIVMLVRAIYALTGWLVMRDPAVFLEEDSESYLAPARELLANGTFSSDGRPELQRSPGYPLLLAVGVFCGKPILVTIAIQVLLSGLTALGVIVTANRVTRDWRIGAIAGAIYAFEPISMRQAIAIGTETLFTTMVVWALPPIIAYVRGGKLASLLAGIALLATATYVRPAGYYLPFGLLAFIGVVAVARRDWRRLAHLGAGAVLAIGIVLPWHLRNRAFGYSGFSAIVAVNMYFYNAAAVQAERTGTSYADMQVAMGYRDGRVYSALHPEQDEWSPGQRFAYMGAEGARIVRDNLLVYGRIHLAGMLRVLFDPGALTLLEPYGLYTGNSGILSVIVTRGILAGLQQILRTNLLAFVLLLVFGALLATTYALALRGWLANGGALDPIVLLLVITSGYFIVIAGGPVGVGRFRHSAMPFVCVLAAMGVMAWRAKRIPALARRVEHGVAGPASDAATVTARPTVEPPVPPRVA